MEQAQPHRKAKHPARADGLFGVCALMVGGRAQGRTMKPICYRGKVFGMTAWKDVLVAVEELARKKGQDDRKNIADPTKK